MAAQMDKVLCRAVLCREEIQRFVDLGLGRGVDSTDPRPWANKTAFQVRNPIAERFNEIFIGTDEGGLLQSYHSRFTSQEDVQVQLKASISIPHTPVSLSVEGELSRSSSSSRKVEGQKATNRTISFRMESQSDSELDTQGSIQLPPSFEEIISRFIWKQICYRNKDRKLEEVRGRGAIHLLGNYLQGSSKEEANLVAYDCIDFVYSFGVTHYVSSITLGASEHTVVAKSTSSRDAKQGSGISIPLAATTQHKSSRVSMFSKSTLNTRCLGRIVDGRVERGSGSEAVIEVKILPIYSLIHHNPFVYLALHKATLDYTEERAPQPGEKIWLQHHNRSIVSARWLIIELEETLIQASS
jgi:hypothetical protein